MSGVESSAVFDTGQRVLGSPRHPRTCLHNTSLYAVAVRWTLIIYLLQFCLFSSIFHISPPHTPLFTHCRTAAEKTRPARVCVCDSVLLHYKRSRAPHDTRKYRADSINKKINISLVMNRKIVVIKIHF